MGGPYYNSYKQYEFRSWKTSYRGKILIHVGLNIGRDMKKIFKDYELDYVSGTIICEVTLVDSILVDDEFDKHLF